MDQTQTGHTITHNTDTDTHTHTHTHTHAHAHTRTQTHRHTLTHIHRPTPRSIIEHTSRESSCCAHIVVFEQAPPCDEVAKHHSGMDWAQGTHTHAYT